MRFNESLERLKVSVEAGAERYDKDGNLNLGYVDGIILPILSDLLKDLCIQIENIHKFNGNDARYVTHYTSMDTLYSLLKNEIKRKNTIKAGKYISKTECKASLLLYDSFHSNDPDEGNYLISKLQEKYSWIKTTDVSHAYITSFIVPQSQCNTDRGNVRDDLVFWRTYGKEGEGCSLEISVPNLLLHRVSYGNSGIQSTMPILRSILDPLDQLAKKDEDIAKIMSDVICKSLEQIRYLYKSKAYNYEHEARIIIPEPLIDDKDLINFEIQGSNSPTTLRHYYELEELAVDNLLISGSIITLGPCVPYVHSVNYYINSLIRKAGLSEPQVRISEISYRKP